MELKICRLEVNYDVNAAHGNETTLPVIPNSDHQPSDSANKQFPEENENPWTTLGARPKDQRTPRLDKENWPRLQRDAPRQVKQQRAVPTTNERRKPAGNVGIPLLNRFAPLQNVTQEDLDINQRYVNDFRSKTSEKGHATGPRTLILCNGSVREIKHFCNKKNTEVLIYNDRNCGMVSDISDILPRILKDRPTLEKPIIQAEALKDITHKRKSEVLKEDYICLLNLVDGLNVKVFLSGPRTPVNCGDEIFSRILMLNKWLEKTCKQTTVTFIDNFNIFWERRHLFSDNGFHLNRSGAKRNTLGPNNTRLQHII
uniref:OSK domain-containing protein n=1 Tax=Fundulus heteroclitus TaxID=8078 RepID=A0A3Q2QQG9_FUNHE